MRSPICLVGLASAVAAVLMSTSAFAEAPIDPGFSYGRPFIYFNYTGSPSIELNAITVDFEGHLISAGRNDSTGTFLVTRLNLDTPTNLDGTFGSGGIAENPFGSINSGIVAVAVDHHDRIVTAGYSAVHRSCGSNPDVYTYYFSAARLKNGGGADDGNIDASFGSGPLGGVTALSVGDCNFTQGATAIAIGANDEVTIGGSAFNGTNNGIALVRWDASGALDSSFGSSGVVNPINSIDTALGAIAIDDEGRTLATAFQIGPGARKFFVYRFNKDGTLDSTFGTSGIKAVALSANSSVCCIAIDSAKRIIVAGTANSPIYSAFVARFKSDGELDENFGEFGISMLPLSGDSSATGLTIDRHDRPIVVGSSEYGVATLTHLNIDGSLNNAVGYGGVFTTAIGFPASAASSVTIDSLGRPNLLIIASQLGGGGSVSAVVRYDELFGEGFD